MTNKELIERYPWLCIDRYFDLEKETYYNSKSPNYEYTVLDEMPEGWRKSFGEMMVAEIDEELRKHDYVDKYYVGQVKEKFGELRWYDTGADIGKVHDIIDKYTVISRHICIVCGKPDVHYTNSGWILPICRECFDKNEFNHIPYEKAVNIDDDPKIPDSYSVRVFSNDEIKTMTYDISQTAELIRKKWVDSN